MMVRICDVPILNRFCCACQEKAPPPKLVEIKKRRSASQELIRQLNLITRIALGIIAMMTSTMLFIPFYLVGMGLGLYHHHYSSHHHGDHEISGCGQGFMESMADMHFPPEISLIANLGVTVCHIDHHPLVFVPYTALALGMWAGQKVDKPLTNAITWMWPSHSVAAAVPV